MEKIVSPCRECYRKDRKVCFKNCPRLAAYRKRLNETVGYPHEFLGMSCLEHMEDGCFWMSPVGKKVKISF